MRIVLLLFKRFIYAINVVCIVLASSISSANAYKSSKWSGFYLGGKVGGAWGENTNKTTVTNNGNYFTTTDPAQIAAVGSQNNSIDNTDRGSQYASTSHRNIIKQHGIIQSMSRKGNCWDNAVSESFFIR